MKRNKKKTKMDFSGKRVFGLLVGKRMLPGVAS